MHKKLIKPSINSFVSELSEGKIDATHIFNELNKHQIDFYWHPLGFILATYLEENNKKIRIHIWPKEGSKIQKPNYNIHDHIFDLTSWIIEGEITNTEYTVTKTEYAKKCIYSVEYQNKISSLVQTPQFVKLEVSKSQKYSKGSTYHIDTNIMHSSERTSVSSALTVVLSIDKSSTHPIVIGETSGEKQYSYIRNKVAPTYIKNLMDEICSLQNF